MADADDKTPVPGGKHSLTDHLLGQDFVHEHGEDADHDHDHFEFDPNERLEDNPIWIQDHVTLTSVGIDIGSSGTQVIFSRINLRRYGEDLTSRYYVVSRETLFQSPVALTPYQSDERIDDAALGASSTTPMRPRASSRATSTPAPSSSPARRCGARMPRRLPAILAEQGGDFVCATAGHHMESMLAAYGSGAARVSHDEDKRILNIDIGGGTTKLAVVEKGQRDRHRGGAYRRPAAGGGRGRPHRAARSRRPLPCRARPASIGAAATSIVASDSTGSPTGWPTRW